MPLLRVQNILKPIFSLPYYYPIQELKYLTAMSFLKDHINKTVKCHRTTRFLPFQELLHPQFHADFLYPRCPPKPPDPNPDANFDSDQ